MVLTKEEINRIETVLRDICGTDGCLNYRDLPPLYRHEDYFAVSFTNNIYARIKIVWLGPPHGDCLCHGEPQFYKDGFFHDTEINLEDDGPWWDVIRKELPHLEELVMIDKIKHHEEEDTERDSEENYRKKELEDLADHINGKRWWKFWWKRK